MITPHGHDSSNICLWPKADMLNASKGKADIAKPTGVRDYEYTP